MSDKNNSSSGRQVIYFFLGFLILFIFTFSLGVIVGKGLGKSETQIVRKERSSETSHREVDKSEKTPETIVGEELSPKQTPSSAKGIETRIKEEKIPLPLSTPRPTKAEIKKEETTKKEFLSEHTSVPSSSKQAEQKAKSEKTGVKEEQIPSSTLGPVKVEFGKKQEFTEKDVAAVPATQTEARYTVQIGAFQKKEEAKKIVDPLKSKGYPAFIKTVEILGKGTWYRIRIGTFKTREEAKLYGDNLRSSEPSIKSVFVTVND
jgi:DedD protein